MLTVLTGMAGSAVAEEFANFAIISSTLGMHGSRLCIGEASRGDIGCPTYAPSLTSAGHVSVTGNLSAAKFIGDGSGLTGLGTGDRISTSGVASGANLGMVVADQGTVSFTTGGVAGTAYLTTTGLFVGPGISATANTSSFTTIYASGNVGIGTAPSTSLTVSGTVWGRMFVYEARSGLASPISQTGTGGGGSGTPGGSHSYVQFNSGGTFAGSSRFTWNDGTSTLAATNVAVSGNLSTGGTVTAAHFVGDGSGLTGVGSADALVSNTTRVTANGASGYISLTTAGTTTGYFSPGGVLVANGISTTTNQASVTTLKANNITTASLASDAPAGFCDDDANIGKMIRDPATGKYGLCRAN
ncbi:hypothetical protein [Rhodoplanes sp. SY1]|uniref:hypothetical protein n=1 Tax=Rhodoplanes sp. SY1 TaxID=3166646 RepID=UPI0038B6298A